MLLACLIHELLEGHRVSTGSSPAEKDGVHTLARPVVEAACLQCLGEPFLFLVPLSRGEKDADEKGVDGVRRRASARHLDRREDGAGLVIDRDVSLDNHGAVSPGGMHNAGSEPLDEARSPVAVGKQLVGHERVHKHGMDGARKGGHPGRAGRRARGLLLRCGEVRVEPTGDTAERVGERHKPRRGEQEHVTERGRKICKHGRTHQPKPFRTPTLRHRADKSTLESQRLRACQRSLTCTLRNVEGRLRLACVTDALWSPCVVAVTPAAMMVPP